VSTCYSPETPFWGLLAGLAVSWLLERRDFSPDRR
jgi:hypothetical protein